MDINSILEEVGWGPYQYYIVAVSSFSWMIVNYWFVGIAIIIDELSEAWGITALQAGLLTASQSAGSIIGGYYFGWLADTKGRLYSLKITNVIYIVFTALLTASVNIWMVIVSFFFVGLSYGGDMQNTNTLLADQLPLSKRYVLSSLAATWSIGGVIIAFLGLMLSYFEVGPILIFRIVCGFIEISVILLFIMRLYMEETPKFYLSQGMNDEAQRVLEIMAKGNNKELTTKVNNELINTQDEPLIQSSSKEGKSKLGILYSSPMLITTLKLNVIYILGSGAVGLQAFMGLILAQSGSNPGQTTILLVILIQQIASIPGVFIAARLIDTCLGRKWIGALGWMFVGVLSFVYAADLNFIAVIVCSSVSWFFLYFGYAGLYTITPESLFTHVRGLGQGLAVTMSRIGTIITTLIIGALLSGGQYIGAIFYIAVLLIGTGFGQLFLRETRGYDIDKNLKIEID